MNQMGGTHSRRSKSSLLFLPSALASAEPFPLRLTNKHTQYDDQGETHPLG